MASLIRDIFTSYYRRDECETIALDRWENEGGRLYRPGTERDSRE